MTFIAPFSLLRESEATAYPLLGGWGDLLSKGREEVSLPSCPRHNCRLCACNRPEQGEAMLNFEWSPDFGFYVEWVFNYWTEAIFRDFLLSNTWHTIWVYFRFNPGPEEDVAWQSGSRGPLERERHCFVFFEYYSYNILSLIFFLSWTLSSWAVGAWKLEGSGFFVIRSQLSLQMIQRWTPIVQCIFTEQMLGL